MPMRSFRFRLFAAFAILILLIALPLVVTWRGLSRSGEYSQRATLAHRVLDAHLALSERGERLLRQVQSQGTSSNDARVRELRNAIAREMTRAREAITAEVELIGPGGAGEEVEELARLEQINQRLISEVEGRADGGWRRLVRAAILEEQREIALLNLARSRIDRAVQGTLLGSAIAAVLIGAALLFWLQRQIRQPLVRLLAGTEALTKGALDHRIGLASNDEFGRLGASFDQMAAVLEQQTETIARSRDELEATVATRTEALEQANAQLTEVADRRRRFLADISHELRTPLTVIRSEAEVAIRGGGVPAALGATLTRIGDQALAMGRLVDDLLFVARSEAGVPKLNLKPVRLEDILRHAADDVRQMIEADGGAMHLISDAKIPVVIGDADRLRQLVGILLDNAMRYSSAAPELTIEVLPSPGGVIFRVGDRGIGIASADLPHVFDRFRRGERARKQNGDGVGLGLPVAKSIVEAHGGTISIDSRDNQGTTVSVFLPGESNGLKAVA